MRFCILSVIVLVFGCTNSKVTSELNRADELMNDHPDSAYVLIQSINPDDIHGRADKAFYALLYTQAQYKNYDTIRNDSLIDIAVKYYSENPTKDRLTRSYMYKAGALSDMERHKEAIEWYKRAEYAADTADYLTLALLNIRMGELYQNSYVPNEEHINRYKKALKYAKLLNNTDFEISALSSIGQLYTRRSKDSTFYYLNSSLKIAEEVKDSMSIFDNLTLLGKAYEYYGLCYEAKELFLYVIKNSSPNLPKKASYFSISAIYARMGQVDSAKYYLNQIKSFARPSDSMRYYMSCEEIAKATNDYRAAYGYSKLSNRISDSIILAGRKNELYSIEKQFDRQRAEVETEKLKAEVKVRTYLIAISVLILFIFAGIVVIVMRRKRAMSINKMRLIEQLQTEIANQEGTLKRAMNRQIETIASLEKSLSERNEIELALREIVEDRMLLMRKLMNIKHEFGTIPSAFITHFDKLVSLNKKSQPEIDSVIKIANQLNNNVISRIQESNPTLKPQDILFLSLVSLQFTTTEITAFVGSPNVTATYSMRYRLSKKLNCSSIEDYITKASV